MFYLKIESDGEGDPIELAIDSVQKVPPALILKINDSCIYDYDDIMHMRKCLQDTYGDIPILFIDSGLSLECADFDTLVKLRQAATAALVRFDVEEDADSAGNERP